MSELRAGILPRGLRREQAAAYCGISARHFDKLVEAGDLPRPRCLGATVRIWDRADLDATIESLPVDGEPEPGANEWDDVLTGPPQ